MTFSADDDVLTNLAVEIREFTKQYGHVQRHVQAVRLLSRVPLLQEYAIAAERPWDPDNRLAAIHRSLSAAVTALERGSTQAILSSGASLVRTTTEDLRGIRVLLGLDEVTSNGLWSEREEIAAQLLGTSPTWFR